MTKCAACLLHILAYFNNQKKGVLQVLPVTASVHNVMEKIYQRSRKTKSVKLSFSGVTAVSN